MGEWIKQYFEEAFYEIMNLSIGVICLMIINGIYLINLDAYNQKILGQDAFQVMTYDNGSSWLYLLSALGLTFLFVIMVYLLFQSRHEIVYSINIIMLILLGMVCIINVIFLFLYINNPILRSAIVVIFVGGAIIVSNSK